MVISTKLSHTEPFCGCSTVDLQKSPNFLNHESYIKCCDVAKDCPFPVSNVAASFPTESDQLLDHFNQRLYYMYTQSANNNKLKWIALKPECSVAWSFTGLAISWLELERLTGCRYIVWQKGLTKLDWLVHQCAFCPVCCSNLPPSVNICILQH